MTQTADKMQEILQQTQTQTLGLINQTNELQEEKTKFELELEVAGKFLNFFQLSPSDHQILYGKTRDEKITSEFFRVLDQVQAIYNESKILIQAGFEALAMDIMENMVSWKMRKFRIFRLERGKFEFLG